MSRYFVKVKALVGCSVTALSVMGVVASTMPALSDGILNGKTIRIIAVGDPVFQTMQKIHEDLEKQSGGKIELTVLPFDQVRQQVLLNSQAKESRYDIVAVDLPQFGEYQTFLTDLTPYVQAAHFDSSDFQKAAWDGVVHGGKILAIPVQPQPEIFAYRTDLFEKAGLQPPQTTDDVIADAQKLTDPANKVAGICWNAARGTPLGQTFLQVLGSFGQAPLALTKTGDDYDIGNIKPENMKPKFDTPAALGVAKYLQALMKYSPPGILNMAWDERTRVFTQGGCAMTYIWTGSAANYEADASAPSHGKVAYVSAPSGMGAPHRSPLGGWSLGIPTNLSKDKQDLAWQAIQWLTTKEMMTEYTKHGDCVSPRHSVSSDADVVNRCPVIKAVDDLSNKGEISSWQRPPVPELQQIVDVLGSQMHEVISGKKTPEEAIKESQKLVDRTMREAGYY